MDGLHYEWLATLRVPGRATQDRRRDKHEGDIVTIRTLCAYAALAASFAIAGCAKNPDAIPPASMGDA